MTGRFPGTRGGNAIAAVTFDATGTLFHCPRLAAIYREVLTRHGVEAEEKRLRSLISRVWQELDIAAPAGRDRFTAHPKGPRGWWARFVERLCEHLGAAPPSAFAVAELYQRFGRAEAWELYPDVSAVLAELAQRGLPLAVVSNWDPRLPELLDDLGLAGRFVAVVSSSSVGIEKPDPRLFAAAVEALGVEPERVLHVGDSRRHDVEGAEAAGLRALHLDRRPGATTDLEAGRIAGLGAFLEIV